MYNKVILIGRITKKPELKTTSNGVAYTKFNLAVTRDFNKEETDFFRVTLWKGQAENVVKYQDKGSLIMVEGRVELGSYEKDDGTKVYTTEIMATNVKFLEPKKSKDLEEEPKISDFENEDLPF